MSVGKMIGKMSKLLLPAIAIFCLLAAVVAAPALTKPSDQPATITPELQKPEQGHPNEDREGNGGGGGGGNHEGGDSDTGIGEGDTTTVPDESIKKKSPEPQKPEQNDSPDLTDPPEQNSPPDRPDQPEHNASPQQLHQPEQTDSPGQADQPVQTGQTDP